VQKPALPQVLISRKEACKNDFILPVKVMTKLVRGKFLDSLKKSRDVTNLFIKAP
jgi:hypothetical protein